MVRMAAQINLIIVKDQIVDRITAKDPTVDRTIQSHPFALVITVHPNLIHVSETTARIDLVAVLVPIVRSQRPVRVRIVVRIIALVQIVPIQIQTIRTTAADQIVQNRTQIHLVLVQIVRTIALV